MKKKSIALLMILMMVILSACSGEAPDAGGKNSPSLEFEKETVEYLIGDELIAYFQQVYNHVVEQQIPQEYRLETELLYLPDFNDTGKELPADYEEQYLNWRPENKNAEAEQTTSTLTEIEFIDVQETVYATSDVNIRDYCSTNGNKIGSLSKNQAIFRIGIGTGEGEGWSRVSMENGEVGFIKSEYLTLTKPTTQKPAETSKPVETPTETPSQSNTNTNNNQSQGGTAVDVNNNGIPDVWEVEIDHGAGGTKHIDTSKHIEGSVQDYYPGITIQ